MNLSKTYLSASSKQKPYDEQNSALLAEIMISWLCGINQ